MSRETVLVVGATGWLGRHVVEQLHARGFRVRALVRRSSDTSGLGDAELCVGDVDRPESLLPEFFQGVTYVLSCLGLRSLSITDRELYRTIRDGTLAVFRRAEAARTVHRMVLVAGGIHAAWDGTPLRSMDHNAAREAALDCIRAACARPGAGIAWTAIDASVFFKDAGRFFDMAAERGTISLVGHAAFDAVRFNPISGRDLATAMVDAMTDPALANRRVRVGGPKVFTFSELAGLISGVLGRQVRCQVIPVIPARMVATLLWLLARLTQSRALLGTWRFLNFVLVVSLDDQPESLVGEARGSDQIEAYFRERAERLRRKAAPRPGSGARAAGPGALGKAAGGGDASEGSRALKEE